ncbi:MULTISPECIES: DUF3231 family protein [Sutcliffiella]|uniref:DUF3231 family protein n=1 Tax=Sutcliffiella cohnii TaxID=33932 RepID=A0A223KNG0_9BACI|nr:MULTISPECIES: DUF3231 family protein [Sutcliffiella]AST91022.1 hypothetical protein BC6307_06885 [Sutcliffiella cohnii]WBL16820.1 DUF3231 family protein [Sutcliffiella sp. NC1]
MHKSEVPLTSTELSNIWAAYLMSNLIMKLTEYFSTTTDDEDIKIIVEKMFNASQQNIEKLTTFFMKEDFPTPIGFTERDVVKEASKVFSDTFILYFCHDITLLALTTYPSALSDCTRKDTRNYFHTALETTIQLQDETVELMLEKGIYLKPPQLTFEKKVEFVDSKKYLSKSLSEARALNAAEIANITRIIHRAYFSKMIFVTFNKLSNDEELKKHFGKGRDVIESTIDSLKEVLEEENVPISASGDYQIFDVEVSPFSDKLMLYFVNACLGMFCFTMIGQALNTTLRSDIILKLTNINNKMKKYYGESLFLTINKDWFEQPPQAVDRKLE